MAQKTRAQLQSQIDSLLANNTAGNISASDVRTVDGDNIDSNLNLETTGITEEEAGYLDGVTSLIQTQIDSKASLTGATFRGPIRGNVAITGFRPHLIEMSDERILALTDAGTFISTENEDSIIVRIPINAAVEFTAGTEIDFIQKGKGTLRLRAETGVTLNGIDGNEIVVTAQWGGVTIKKIAENEWIAVGKI
jgi:hypothetical protein